MRRNKLTAAVLSALLSITLFASVGPADAKKWTVTKRMEDLSAKIDTGRKANELTTKQVAELKKTLVDIQSRIDKMKEKNGGKLAIKDSRKIHRQLNDVSVKILRYRLDNVYR